MMLTKDKRNKKNLDREEYGYGFDISVDDLGVIGQNNEAKKQNDNENKDKPHNKDNPSTLNK
ncbi:MAG: hypothetical protein M3043_10430 [Lysinibacillus fusiformis]|nr:MULTISPECIES: hypothetical protein [Lysinibacillus]MDC6269348.1 hypothetical protein [Lysinibacillus sphaericus]MCE4045081.1 hypothetical protein [Lysinibacillus fusiformis]MCK1989504.1 hypothetical protein [Lysinibacillus fusiformis]MCT6816804.1 hypothetical protein [Lysinibacillus fusiformis]MCT6929560.1 hypothetical protein [Lysinibacillus fusiformis]